MTAYPPVEDILSAAKKLIKKNQPVFPCYSTGERAKQPMTKRGLNDASLSMAQVKNWWKTHPTAALAIPTGHVWDVLDVDVKDDRDGRVHLPYLQRLGLLDGCQRVVKTPSGGWHLYFPAAQGLTNKAHAQLGLDVRAKGGYVLAPPSVLVTDDYSGAYQRLDDPTENTDDPLLWDLIISSLAPVNKETKKPVDLLPSERRASLAALREWVSVRQPGERNNALHWAVCRCIENGLDPRELIEPALLAGLTEEETLKTIGSALKRAGAKADDLLTEAEAMFG